MKRTEENITTVARQVGRFQSMNYGCNEDRQTELCDVFLGFDNTEDVSRAVSHFIHTTVQSPTVVEVLNYQRDLDRKKRSTLKAADPNCPDCSGTGWRQVIEKRITLWGMREFTAVEICHCKKVKVAA